MTSRVGRNCVILWPLTSVTEKVSERWAQRSKVTGAEYKKDYSSIEKGEKDAAVLRVIKATRDCGGQTRGDQLRRC